MIGLDGRNGDLVFVSTTDSNSDTARAEDQSPLGSVAEALLSRAIQHRALTPEEARTLATWDLTTITEYLALRLEKEGLLTARECRDVLGFAAENDSAH